MAKPRRLLLAAFAAWTICVALGLACRAPLTSDEAAYALIARGDGESWLYRSRGVVAMARAGLLLGDNEIALRLVPTLASLSFVLAVFAVGRRAFSPRVGAASAAVLAGAHPFVLRGFELLGDVPAAACLLVRSRSSPASSPLNHRRVIGSSARHRCSRPRFTCVTAARR